MNRREIIDIEEGTGLDEKPTSIQYGSERCDCPFLVSIHRHSDTCEFTTFAIFSNIKIFPCGLIQECLNVRKMSDNIQYIFSCKAMA